MKNGGGPLSFFLALVVLLMTNSLTVSQLDTYLNPLKFVKANTGFHGVKPKEHSRPSPRTIPEEVTIWAGTMNVTVEGFTMETIKGNPVYAFQGIRYAPMPERFQAPITLEDDYYYNNESMGNGYIRAIHLPDKCAQSGFIDNDLAVGTEDCLFLNVYTPKLQFSNGTYEEMLPVMMFIHGGGFTSGDTSLYLPTRLCDKDVILVTIQYRLGSFGFFSTGDELASGNSGLYDQNCAMQWVQKYISDFGGDVNRVTIFGQSAGSASVTHHLLSYLSPGLFHGVIAESGSALDYWAIDPDPVASATAIAKIHDCPGNWTDMQDVYDCMMDLSMEELVWGIQELSEEDMQNGMMGFRGTSPIVQDFLNYTEAIIFYDPEVAFHDGHFNKDVSLMIGANRDEGSFVFGLMYSYYLVPNNLTENELFIQEEMIPTLLNSFGVSDKTHALSESLALEYLGTADRTSLEEVTPGMIDMSGVLFEKAGVYECAKYHSLWTNETDDGSTFFYSFDFLSDDSMFEWLFIGTTEPPFYHGVTHSDELMYIFSLPADQDEEEKKINDMMVEMWTNFATYFNPTPEEKMDELEEMDIEKWEEFDIENQTFMVMESTFHTEQYYTQRWTINTEHQDADDNKTVTTMWPSSTEGGGMTNPTASATTQDTCQEDLDDLETAYNDLEYTKNVYMGLMIAFIILFVIEACACCYLFYKLYYQ